MKKIIIALSLVLTMSASNASEVTLDKKYFKISYSTNHKGASSVSYTLERNNVNDKNIKKRPSFYTEKSLPKKYQTHTKDYSHTGYDRGHIANDASFDWSQESLKSTYSMANITPQLPNTNRRAWLSVEEMERYTATQFEKIDVTNIIEYKSKKILQKKPVSEILSTMKFASKDAEFKYIAKYKKAQKYLKNKKIHIPSGFYKILESKPHKFKECYYVSQGASDSNAKKYLIDCSKVMQVKVSPYTPQAVPRKVVKANKVKAKYAPVKLSKSKICHEKGTTYYNRVKRFKRFETIKQCLKFGRLPKR